MKLRKLFYILSKWILTLFSTSHNAIIGIFITYRSISTLNHSERTTIPKKRNHTMIFRFTSYYLIKLFARFIMSLLIFSKSSYAPLHHTRQG